MANPFDQFDAPKASGGNPFDQFTPASSQTPAAADTTAGMSNYEKAMAGAGKSAVDIWRGLKQIGAQVGNSISSSLVSDQTVKNIQSDIDEAKRLDAPLMNTGAGQLGYLGGNLATTLIPAGLVANGAKAAGLARTATVANALANPTTYGAAITAGAVQGGIQPVASDESRLFNTGVGAIAGGAGNALVNGVGRIAQPVNNALNASGQKAVQALKDAGVPLDAAQMTGSKALTKIKSALGDNPFTSGAQKEMQENQQQAFNNAVLNTIGESGTSADQTAMASARSRIGQVFDDVAARNPVAFDNQLQTELAHIENGATSVLNDQQLRPIKNQLDQIIAKSANNGGAMDGAAYQNLKQNLDTLSAGNDSTVAQYARDIRSALDDALARSTSTNGNPDDYALLQQARLQWGNMRKIEGAIDKEGTGNISPSRLANIMGQKANRNASVYGYGNQDLVNLAQSGKQILPDKMPNSGTAARAAMQIALPLAAGTAQGAYTGDWAHAAGTAASVAALPKLMQMAINNPAFANYLANGLANGPARSILLAPQTNALVGGSIRRALPSTGNSLLAN